MFISMKSIILPLAVVASLASGNMNSDNQDVRHPYEPIKTVENVCVEHKGVLDNYY